MRNEKVFKVIGKYVPYKPDGKIKKIFWVGTRNIDTKQVAALGNVEMVFSIGVPDPKSEAFKEMVDKADAIAVDDALSYDVIRRYIKVVRDKPVLVPRSKKVLTSDKETNEITYIFRRWDRLLYLKYIEGQDAEEKLIAERLNQIQASCNAICGKVGAEVFEGVNDYGDIVALEDEDEDADEEYEALVKEEVAEPKVEPVPIQKAAPKKEQTKPVAKAEPTFKKREAAKPEPKPAAQQPQTMPAQAPAPEPVTEPAPSKELDVIEQYAAGLSAPAREPEPARQENSPMTGAERVKSMEPEHPAEESVEVAPSRFGKGSPFLRKKSPALNMPAAT